MTLVNTWTQIHRGTFTERLVETLDFTGLDWALNWTFTGLNPLSSCSVSDCVFKVCSSHSTDVLCFCCSRRSLRPVKSFRTDREKTDKKGKSREWERKSRERKRKWSHLLPSWVRCERGWRIRAHSRPGKGFSLLPGPALAPLPPPSAGGSSGPGGTSPHRGACTSETGDTQRAERGSDGVDSLSTDWQVELNQLIRLMIMLNAAFLTVSCLYWYLGPCCFFLCLYWF